LWREGAKIALQPRPFAVRRYLVEHTGRLITHDKLARFNEAMRCRHEAGQKAAESLTAF
jgi:DNA-binding response OmpR family regulator